MVDLLMVGLFLGMSVSVLLSIGGGIFSTFELPIKIIFIIVAVWFVGSLVSAWRIEWVTLPFWVGLAVGFEIGNVIKSHIPDMQVGGAKRCFECPACEKKAVLQDGSVFASFRCFDGHDPVDMVETGRASDTNHGDDADESDSGRRWPDEGAGYIPADMRGDSNTTGAEYRWLNVDVVVDEDETVVRVEGRGPELPFGATESIGICDHRRIHYEVQSDGPITHEGYAGPADDPDADESVSDGWSPDDGAGYIPTEERGDSE